MRQIDNKMAEEGGEVSGNKDDFMKKCSPCLEKGTEKGAEKYCYVCKTFFCGNCIIKHNELFSEHRLTNTGSVDIDVALKLDTEVCQQHGRPLILYCKDDKTIGCDMCMDSEHGSCAEVVYLPKLASSILQDIEMNEIKTKLKETIQRFESIKVTQQATIADIESDRDTCLQEIDAHQEEIVILVDKIVKSSKDKVLQTFERVHAELQHGHQEVKHFIENLKTNEEQLERKQGHDVELLLEIKKQEKQEQSTEEVLNKTLKSLKVTGFTVAIDTRLHVLLSEMESLGTMLLKRMPVKVKKRSQVDISVKGEKICDVWGSCVLPDGSVVLADSNNKRLVRLDQQSLRIIDQCLMDDNPRDVCCIDMNTVAVTQGDNKVVFVSMTPQLSVTRSIQINHYCYYLTYSRGELFIIDNNKIYVYDMKGNPLRTITTDVEGQKLFSSIQSMAVSDDGNKLYVADGQKGLMTLDRQWKLIDTLVATNKLSCIQDVCLDGAGGLFVARYWSHNVVHVGPDGKTLTEVLTMSDGLVYPVFLCYDRVGRRLFVSQSNNNQLFVCDLE